MELKTCKDCRRFFQYSGFGEELCPACKQKDEDDFDNVKKYIREHPGCQFKEVSKQTKVPERKLTAWIKEERLIIPKTMDAGLKCDKCGAPIQKGNMCEECKAELASQFAQIEEAFTQQKQSLEELKQQANKDKGLRFIRDSKKK